MTKHVPDTDAEIEVTQDRLIFEPFAHISAHPKV